MTNVVLTVTQARILNSAAASQPMKPVAMPSEAGPRFMSVSVTVVRIAGATAKARASLAIGVHGNQKNVRQLRVL